MQARRIENTEYRILGRHQLRTVAVYLGFVVHFFGDWAYPTVDDGPSCRGSIWRLGGHRRFRYAYLTAAVGTRSFVLNRGPRFSGTDPTKLADDVTFPVLSMSGKIGRCTIRFPKLKI